MNIQLYFNSNLNDYFATMLTIVVALNSVALPLAYNIISENLKPYLDRNFHKVFIDEKVFKQNIIISLVALPLFGIPLLMDLPSFLNIKEDTRITDAILNLYILLTFFYMAGFLILFSKFSLLIYKYASNTEEIVFNYIKENIEKCLENESE